MQLNQNTNTKWEKPHTSIEKKNNYIFIGPCISTIILGVYVLFVFNDVGTESQYAGLGSFLLSFVIETLLIIISIFSLSLHYKNAKYKSVGLLFNLIVIAVGLLLPLYLIIVM